MRIDVADVTPLFCTELRTAGFSSASCNELSKAKNIVDGEIFLIRDGQLGLCLIIRDDQLG